MKLSSWARQQGLSYKTAWRLWKAGKLPVPAEQLITDDIVRDLHRVIVSMCARRYGKRAAKNRAKKAMEAIRCG